MMKSRTLLRWGVLGISAVVALTVRVAQRGRRGGRSRSRHSRSRARLRVRGPFDLPCLGRREADTTQAIQDIESVARPTPQPGNGQSPRAVRPRPRCPPGHHHVVWTGRSAAEPIARRWISAGRPLPASGRLRGRSSGFVPGRRCRRLGLGAHHPFLNSLSACPRERESSGSFLARRRVSRARVRPRCPVVRSWLCLRRGRRWGVPACRHRRALDRLLGRGLELEIRQGQGERRDQQRGGDEQWSLAGHIVRASSSPSWDGGTREWIPDGLSRSCGRVEERGCGMAGARHRSVVGGAKRRLTDLRSCADHWRMTWRRFARSRSW